MNEKLRDIDVVVTLNQRPSNECVLCGETWPSIGMVVLPASRGRHCGRPACEVEASFIWEANREAYKAWSVPNGYSGSGMRTGRIQSKTPNLSNVPSRSAGMGTPPIHGRCWTTIAPVGHGKSIAVAASLASMSRAMQTASLAGQVFVTAAQRTGRKIRANLTIQGLRHDIVFLDDPCLGVSETILKGPHDYHASDPASLRRVLADLPCRGLHTHPAPGIALVPVEFDLQNIDTSGLYAWCRAVADRDCAPAPPRAKAKKAADDRPPSDPYDIDREAAHRDGYRRWINRRCRGRERRRVNLSTHERGRYRGR